MILLKSLRERMIIHLGDLRLIQGMRMHISTTVCGTSKTTEIDLVQFR